MRENSKNISRFKYSWKPSNRNVQPVALQFGLLLLANDNFRYWKLIVGKYKIGKCNTTEKVISYSSNVPSSIKSKTKEYQRNQSPSIHIIFFTKKKRKQTSHLYFLHSRFSCFYLDCVRTWKYTIEKNPVIETR